MENQNQQRRTQAIQNQPYGKDLAVKLIEGKKIRNYNPTIIGKR